MIVKGNEASVTWADGTSDAFPKHFVVCHDATGKHLRRCDFYIVQAVPSSSSLDEFSDAMIREAMDYYEESTLGVVGIVLPSGAKYKPIGPTKQLRYRRHGSNRDILGKPYRGRFYHDWDEDVSVPIRLGEGRPRIVESIAPAAIVRAAQGRPATTARAWRIVLPSGCVANRHGFTWP